MTENFNPNSHRANTSKLSPDEWREKKQLEKEAVYLMIDETANSILEDGNSFKKFLDTQSRMDRYSAANALLIYNQYPQASQLKDFEDWSKDNVKVKKGSKSISILEPVEYTKKDGTTALSYNVKKMFDVSQTNGKQTPAPTVNRDPRKLVSAMIDTSPVNVEVTDDIPSPQMGAFYDNNKKTLYVRKNVGDSVALCQCVAQELAHAHLSVSSERYSRRDMGFPAVCIGYMFCKKHGVDTRPFGIEKIPAEWKDKDSKGIRTELIKMRNALSDMHSRTYEHLQARQQERSSRDRDNR